MDYDAALKADYENLWSTCVVKPIGNHYATQTVNKMRANESRYESIGDVTSVPWWFIAVLHNMECGLNFNKHLHNGDPLTGRTVRVPAGRPVSGNPPFTFEESAVDAIRLKNYHQIQDWSIAHVLFVMEGFNGYGYRTDHPEVKSPYLWSMTNHYIKGKYVRDHVFDPEAVSQQLGIACILKRLLA